MTGNYAKSVASLAGTPPPSDAGWQQTALPAAPTPVGGGVYRYISPTGASAGEGTTTGAPIDVEQFFDVCNAGDVGLLQGSGIHLSSGGEMTNVGSAAWNDHAWLAWDPSQAWCSGDKPTVRSPGGNRILAFNESHYIGLYNFIVDGFRVDARGNTFWGVVMGPAGPPHIYEPECSHFKIYGLDFIDIGQEPLKLSRIDTVDIVSCTMRDAGLVNSQYGEGIYSAIGGEAQAGSTAPGVANNVLIDGLEVSHSSTDLGNEAIDIKVPTQNLTIRNVWLHDITVNSQGAITIYNNDGDFGGNANVLLEDIFIARVNRRNSDGAAISVSRGSITVNRMVAWDIDAEAVLHYRNTDDGTNNTTTFNQLIAWDAGQLGTNYVNRNANNPQNQTIPDETDLTLTINNMIADVAEGDVDYVATAADFVGPLTGDADAGTGPGSGFRLAAGSSIPESAGAVGKE